jgi:hypothetical protein
LFGSLQWIHEKEIDERRSIVHFRLFCCFRSHHRYFGHMTLQLKNYGVRTLMGNWFEERQNLKSYVQRNSTPLDIRDMSVDVHIACRSENPPLDPEVPREMITTYGESTDRRQLEVRDRNLQRLRTSDARKRLSNSVSLCATTIPGSTITPVLLSRQFIDPNQVWHSTSYEAHYGRPEFEAIRGSSLRAENTRPRMTALTETWDPTWN